MSSSVGFVDRPGAEREADLLAALGAKPLDASIALELARLYVSLGRPIDALHRLDVASVQSSADPAEQDKACRLLIELGDFEAAVRQAARGLTLTDNSQLLAHHERALRRLLDETALGLTPRLKRTYLKGLDRLMRDRPTAAAELFDKVVRRAPAYAPAWIALRGAIEARDGRDAGAAIAARWSEAMPQAAAITAVGVGRTLAANGLVFDPRAGAPLLSMDAVLTPVASLQALAEAPAGILQLDPGGASMVLHPVIEGGAAGPATSVRYETAEVFLAGLDNAALVGRGVVLTADGAMLRELHGANLDKYGAQDLGDRASFEPAMFQGGLGEVKVFDTPALLLCAATDKSFGDWMINFIPRLAIARAAGLNCPVVVSPKAPEPFIEMLHAFGVSDDDIILHDRNGVSLFSKLYVPSWPMRSFLQPMAGLFEVYRDLSLPPTDRPGRRLYFSREQVARRDLVNEREVCDLFVRHGFEVVHPQALGLARMRELLADAAYVAAPYGSALLNLAFAGRKPLSIVCMPPQKPGFLAQTALWLGVMGLQFAYVTGELVGAAGQHTAKDAPWTAPLPALAQVLETILSAAV